MGRRNPTLFRLALLLAPACASSHRAGAPSTEDRTEGVPAPVADSLRVLSTVPAGERYFRHYGTNPTVDTLEESVSSFAVDVDTGSYTLARSALTLGEMPDEAAVRVEEFVNAFEYGYEPPADVALGLWVEAFPSPFRPGFHVLRLGLRARKLSSPERPSAHLILVLDLSESMAQDGRFKLLKSAMRQLVQSLEPDDTVGIVGFREQPVVLLPPTSLAQKDLILGILGQQEVSGASNLSAALALGYDLAKKSPPTGSHRLILCSDGVTDLGPRNAREILDLIGESARRGVALTTVGVGNEHYDDVMLEQLADAGDGQYAHIDRPEEGHRLLVRALDRTLHIAARNAKVQVEFDPRVVSRYRLLGYENRRLEHPEFHDRRVDGGEIGVGGSVTALYEVKLRQQDRPMGALRLHFEDPRVGSSVLLSRPLLAPSFGQSFDGSSAGAQLAVAVAGFAEKLRGSYWARGLRYETLLEQIRSLPDPMRDSASVLELAALIERARRLDERADRFESEMPMASMSFDEVPILR